MDAFMKSIFPDFTNKDWFFLILTLIGILLALEPIFNFREKWRSFDAKLSKKAFWSFVASGIEQLNRYRNYQIHPWLFVSNFFKDIIDFLLMILVPSLLYVIVVEAYFQDLSNRPFAIGVLLFLTLFFLLVKRNDINSFHKPERVEKMLRDNLKHGLEKAWVTEELVAVMNEHIEAHDWDAAMKIVERRSLTE